jgi:DNA-binding NarL/FixJ family response regulator
MAKWYQCKCQQCGKRFLALEKNRRFCSRKCVVEWSKTQSWHKDWTPKAPRKKTSKREKILKLAKGGYTAEEIWNKTNASIRTIKKVLKTLN